MPNLAALGGKPVRTETYPAWPVFDKRDIEAVMRVVQSGRWGAHPFQGQIRQNLQKKLLQCKVASTLFQ